MSKVNNLEPTRWFTFNKEIYEYRGPIAPKGHSTRSNNQHTDNGWRLRNHPKGTYGSFKEPLHESLDDLPSVIIKGRQGLYQFKDADHQCTYIGMSATCIHDRLWKYGPKIVGDIGSNSGVKDTVEWKNYRNMRKRRLYSNFNDIQVRFFFMDGASEKEIDTEETFLLGMVANKYGFPIANGTRKYKILPEHI